MSIWKISKCVHGPFNIYDKCYQSVFWDLRPNTQMHLSIFTPTPNTPNWSFGFIWKTVTTLKGSKYNLARSPITKIPFIFTELMKMCSNLFGQPFKFFIWAHNLHLEDVRRWKLDGTWNLHDRYISGYRNHCIFIIYGAGWGV